MLLYYNILSVMQRVIGYVRMYLLLYCVLLFLSFSLVWTILAKISDYIECSKLYIPIRMSINFGLNTLDLQVHIGIAHRNNRYR